MCGFLISETNEDFQLSSQTLKHRGPDHFQKTQAKNGAQFYFYRLSIMDTSAAGNQPFQREEDLLVCNGEIYNQSSLKSDLKGVIFSGESDCEVLLPYYQEYGIQKLCDRLDAEFAFCLYDHKKNELIAARDPIGIRPLFYGETKKNKIVFASEAKALIGQCQNVKTFPPGHWWSKTKGFVKYYHVQPKIPVFSEQKALKGIREHLIEGVRKRLESDVPLGFLLSGGLDSSLVCAIASKILDKKITTFSVGINKNPIDTHYAKQVADYLKTDHHEYLFSFQDVLDHLEKVIYHLETFDITTIRASMGMFLLCNYIKKQTQIKVILTGEVSDELFGYKYTDYAPDAKAFQQESEKRVEELYMYDVLRADRCISANSLEARVPFGDKAFMDFVLSIDPSLKMNHTGVGKYLLRKAFEKDELLPSSILMREKAAFSDAVGHSMVDQLKLYAEGFYSESEFKEKSFAFKHAQPLSKEALLYREIFEKSFKGKSYLVKDFWLPNHQWENCNVTDPSARELPNYGKSGT